MKKFWLKSRIFIILLLLLVLAVFLIFQSDYSFGRKTDFGVSFSPDYAVDLGLNWQTAYLAILNDLKIDNIRLSAYWNKIEPQVGRYDFKDLDWQINQATNHNAKIVLAVGRRLPRWPECHDPNWLNSLESQQVDQKILGMIKVVVNRYQSNQNIVYWQVENEPLLSFFGTCPPPDQNFLHQEVELVHQIDPSRLVIVTDSGELSAWQKAASVGDILGTTMYRIVWNQKTGFFKYWFNPPAYYAVKSQLTEFFHRNLKSVMVTELQMEPWSLNKRMIDMTQAEQQTSFDLEKFKSNIDYVKKTGLNPVYLWGVEYWYWQKTLGNDSMWNEAKTLWQ
ncbi:MAG: beta-galactosidase [Candidatus Buchananbacteria bacterium]|nr:beta-galactosidase [Candidatus Buchananbacteria bacterium]